mmetsp:Transcript_25418/g.43396  ORF Transcript_25418/g.43396 Transcript_25418/m.43396 type:complete len:107 (-) Transcript_25418:1760-2080(-)|eukprot:CAMPEP_0184435772 /NCGR_PEP_ID=MMETSP0738-20130409/508157_1 /TAXON_ID=385413 /ORGANISM="Thalassiosira miniscula, Strain CCMP1093" /LENGTH=106 /DNA_ID=CAMNT_0026802299 /DNA_START=28 /DNA_END=348 /DNA_ORIENTATION=-
MAASTSSSSDNSTVASATSPIQTQSTQPMKPSPDDGAVTPVQLALGAMILGASAGLTLYTKKTSHMLNQLERASANATIRKGPQKFGPKTKPEWEKTRNRWEKDDL